MEALLGDYAAAVQRYVDAMAPSWEASWTDGMVSALLGTEYESVGLLEPLPSDYDPLVVDSRLCVDYDREEVRRIVLAGMDDGLSPTAIAQALNDSAAFTPARALRVARTENVRSQESGYDRRIGRAVAEGVPIIGNGWLSDPLAARWPRRHDKMHRVVAPLGELFTLPSGVQTAGPGLSGDPGEDVNCRCGRYAVLRSRE